jgi:hypothetical protein
MTGRRQYFWRPGTPIKRWNQGKPNQLELEHEIDRRREKSSTSTLPPVSPIGHIQSHATKKSVKNNMRERSLNQICKKKTEKGTYRKKLVFLEHMA